jgi:hypothetical protein
MLSTGVPRGKNDSTLYSIAIDRLYLKVIPHSALGVIALCLFWAVVGVFVSKVVIEDIQHITRIDAMSE